MQLVVKEGLVVMCASAALLNKLAGALRPAASDVRELVIHK
jgi:hypothetical protein